MSKTLHFLTTPIMLILFMITTARSQTFSQNMSTDSLGLKQEKLTLLHFYFHDVVTGQNPTAIRIVQPVLNNTSTFGAIAMMDNLLTLTPESNSKLVGRAQGIYASASQTEIAFLMVFNLIFSEGEFNGSTLSILGRNPILSTVREMPIVGGSGVFRFARGYAQARTYTFDMVSNNAIVEYNVSVLHY